MKEHSTQRLFWKKWPFKAIIEVSTSRSTGDWKVTKQQAIARLDEFALLKEWTTKHFPNAGTRRETNFSIFFDTEDELQELLDFYGHKVIAVWKPVSDAAMDTLLAHSFDVVRNKLWYDQYPIRARIPYTSGFRETGFKVLKEALSSIAETDWHCAGTLRSAILSTNTPRIYGWGQPVHLYLASTDDAAMLRLHCGELIERFERIRSPG